MSIFKEPSSATYIGFDYGTKKIGVAIGNRVTNKSSPLSILTTKNGNHWLEIDIIVTKWQPNAFIIGKPNKNSGDKLLNSLELFIKTLQKKYNINTYIIDEHLSSQTAKHTESYRKKRNDYIDDIAAALILQNWLNTTKNS